MKVAIFGGTGFIGRSLTKVLQSNGYQVVIVSRNSNKINSSSETPIIEWHGSEPLSSIRPLSDVEVIINLAGESISNRRWTKPVKKEIRESRIRTTQAIVSAINEGSITPKVLINASAVGYYGPCEDEIVTENAQPGQDFLAEVCRAWENEANKVQNHQTRVVTLRIGVVLGPEGALKKMTAPFKFYLGGPLGSGEQWLSWIHISDLTRLILFVIENEKLNGPVNATAPEPVRMKEFSNALGNALNRPSWFPVPEFVLKTVLGEMAEMLLHGQRAIPQKAMEAGFKFKYETITSALGDIFRD